MAAIGGHPYSPSDLELPGFVPQQLSPIELVVPLIGTSLLVITVIWLVSGHVLNSGRPSRLSKADRLLMCWWAITGLTHLIIEAPLLFTPNYLTKENPSFFDEIWKEYSKADSRYATGDTTTTAIEVIAVFLQGPLSLFAVQLRYCFQKVLQLHSTVRCIYEPPLLNVDFLHYRLLRRHELLCQSILLLDIFCWCKLPMGCDSNVDSNKELEVDKPSISVLQGESRLSKPTLCPRHHNYLGSMTPARMGT
uniref:EXPERA domain-containing protein n=1 Tax=Aegilops tauschii subsp. strangulata TaxID=200361 RepID=A0A453JFK9_AEGTS